jgi:hypothetical protein
MSAYLQIDPDPTEWWATQPFQAGQLTGQPLSIPVNAPLQATLVLSGRAASVAVFDSSAQVGPTIEPQVPSIYVPTAAGLSAGNVGYELPSNVNLTDLANQIIASMQSGDNQTITLNGGGTLVLNGATLSFLVLVTPIVLGTGVADPSGSMPHDSTPA